MVSQLEQIDRAIYVAIENVAIIMGLYPDITTMIEAGNELNQVDFDDALQSIIDAGKAPVYIYGTSAPEDRLANHWVDFYIDRQYFQSGNKGYNPVYLETDNPNDPPQGQTFTQRQLNDRYIDIQYKIRYVANSAEAHRNAELILHRALGSNKSLKAIGDQRVVIEDAPNIFIQQNGVPVDIENGGLIERLYRYLVKEVIVYEGDVLDDTIVAAREITLDVAAKNGSSEFDNTDDDIECIIEVE